MRKIRYGRWLVLACVAALVSCMVLPREPLSTSEQRPSPPASEQSSGVIQSGVNPEDADSLWLLRFPRHWVDNNQCQMSGELTMMVMEQQNMGTAEGVQPLVGHLPWVWNNQRGGAMLTGTISGGAIAMTLEPPSIGGFAMQFEGHLADSSPATYAQTNVSDGTPSGVSFAGTVTPEGVCRQQSGTFTLTPLKRLAPSPQMQQRPLLSKPFALEYLMTNYFDHDVPRQFQDDNGYMVTWDGKRLPIGSLGASIDGHAGYDWVLPEGTPLFAVADGTVTMAGESSPFYCPLLNRETAGLQVYIDHPTPEGDRFESEYVHLSRVSVAPGQAVKAGQIIGFSGNTGCSTGPHLHFGIYHHPANQQEWTTLVDPYGWAAATPDPWKQDQAGRESLWLWREGQAPMLYEYGR